MSKAAAGGSQYEKGIKTATAIVAVKPGSAPKRIPINNDTMDTPKFIGERLCTKPYKTIFISFISLFPYPKIIPRGSKIYSTLLNTK
jgi:hypothetical protein